MRERSLVFSGLQRCDEFLYQPKRIFRTGKIIVSRSKYDSGNMVVADQIQDWIVGIEARAVKREEKKLPDAFLGRHLRQKRFRRVALRQRRKCRYDREQ